jgi:hypothetical protein
MQQIDPIHNLGYNARGHLLSGKSKRLKVRSIKGKKPIDAVTFDAVELSGQKDESYTWLASYINDLPDTVIRERTRVFRDSFESVEDFLVDKLIIDEI